MSHLLRIVHLLIDPSQAIRFHSALDIGAGQPEHPHELVRYGRHNQDEEQEGQGTEQAPAQGQFNDFIQRGFMLESSQEKQLLRSSRRNVSPVELIDGPFLMRHEHVAGTLVERREIAPTSSRANGVLHHPPEAFNRVEVVPTMGG